MISFAPTIVFQIFQRASGGKGFVLLRYKIELLVIIWFLWWVGLWRKLSTKEFMLLNCGFGEDSCKSLGLQGDPTSPFWRRSVLGVHWKDWWWSWNSNTLATSCEELTHWKRLWCWEGLGAGEEGDNREWDGWMASLTRWTWVERTPGVGDGQGGLACYDSWGYKESDTTERLNWTELNWTDIVLLMSCLRRVVKSEEILNLS